MADKEIVVNITKVPNGCKPDPRRFEASQGDFVTFKFPEAPDAMIKFRDKKTPFDQENFVIGRKRGKLDATGSFDYDVRWVDPDGKKEGAGSGEILP